MAIVACPECKGQVSSSAAACPHCGHPLGPAVAARPAFGRATAPEETLWEGTPSIKTMTVGIVSTVLFAMVMTTAMALSYHPALRFIGGISDGLARTVHDDEPGLRLAAVVFVVFVVGSRAAKLVWQIVALRGQHYRLSNQRLLIEGGVLSKTITEIDMRAIDEIVFHQTALERLLRVGEIVVISSEPGGRGNRERVRLVGLLDPRAIREKIRTAAYEATGNQVFMRST
ncbi:MAG TPA: PH domain-containing protein [Polyangia bacterium]|jgi:uncharacterized membrane protein YdbT with pleckstrin-like domain